MKKRIRKKRHLGEFKQYGNVIIINTDGKEETAEALLEKFEPIIDKFSLSVAGGGTGRILIPSKKNNKYIPELAVAVVTAVVQEQQIDQMVFCIYVKGATEVPQEALNAIKETFEDEKCEIQIGRKLDLWHTNV